MANRESVSVEKFGRPYEDLTESEKQEVDNMVEEIQENSLRKLRGI